MTTDPMFTTRPELKGTYGMVSSTHWLASSSGMAVLERGGNAFDAVVAAGFVLQVVEPHQNGAGGDLPVLFARAGDPRPTVLCGQGVAPAGASVEHFRSLGLDLVPGSGLLAAAVPGAVPAWLTLLRDHGTMELADVLAYAIGYARDGYPVTPALAQCIADIAPMFREHWSTSAEVYLAGGAAPEAGSVFRNPVLAATYQRLADAPGASREARIDAALAAWSEGFVAEAVDAFARTAWRDSSGADHAGVITGADMAAWRPSYEEPVGYEFAGHTVFKTGPWGQGPVLLQQLALLQGQELIPGTVEFVHRVVEGAKLAFADREAWYGDGSDVPLATLLSPRYNDARRALIGARASLDLRPGSPDGRTPRLPVRPEWAPVPRDASTGEPVAAGGGAARGDTVHVDVVDRWGTMVAAMPSGGWLHSSPVLPELGFCLGTRMQMMWLQDGLASTLTPGLRPRTTLSPTMVVRDGEPVLAFGSPGGDQQDQWQLLFLLNHLVGGMDLQAAIDAPTFHTSHFPESFYPRPAYPGRVVAEARLGDAVLDGLRGRGHEVVVSGDWSLGRMCVVGRDPERGLLRAAANPRGMQGYAVGR
ncbi:gamma-glutamyltransferase family protein [Catenulispora subtropica]|uniref:Gamma-glutamyltransferase n=1 Tax=Catenulispora subtropica TaxID=450798 RepID=A0ABN2RTU2_9ACTN